MIRSCPGREAHTYRRLPNTVLTRSVNVPRIALLTGLLAIEQAQSMDCADVRRGAAEGFDTDHTVDPVIAALHTARLGGSVESKPRI